MNLIEKAVLFYQREGLHNTLTRTCQKVWEQIRRTPGDIAEHICPSRYCKTIADHVRGKQVYILMSCIDWNIPLFKRPHQIATVLSQRENTHVLFVSEKQRYDCFTGMFSVNSNLDVISQGLTTALGDALKQASHITVFKSWPRKAELLEQIPYNTLVYEYIDDISLFYYYTDAMKQKHYDLIREADLTVCTARALYEDALPIAQKVILSPIAGDYAFFRENRNCLAAPGLLEKTRKYECVLGYYGCLADWFDYDLVLEVARRKPEWCFVLVGYCFDGTVSRLQEANLENVLLYPAQPYANLPSFVTAFDIQTIPFTINNITNATSPVKLFEYMATGKPILTSRLPECLQYRSVTTYYDVDDFVCQAQRLMQLRDDPAYCAVMEEEAKANTWDARVAEILRSIDGGNTHER